MSISINHRAQFSETSKGLKIYPSACAHCNNRGDKFLYKISNPKAYISLLVSKSDIFKLFNRHNNKIPEFFLMILWADYNHLEHKIFILKSFALFRKKEKSPGSLSWNQPVAKELTRATEILFQTTFMGKAHLALIH